MKKIIIAHTLSYNLLMHESKSLPNKLNKKYSFIDIKKIKRDDFKKVEIFFGARPEVKTLAKFKNLKKVALISRGADEKLKSYLKLLKIKLYTLDKSSLFLHQEKD